MRNDEELMLDARSGARGAFDEIFMRYRDPIWAFFRRRVADSRVAEELAQDTLVALIEAAPRYAAHGAFRSYLFAIAPGRGPRRLARARDGHGRDADR